MLDEGAFVATYKYALLMALADLSVERGTDGDEGLTLTSKDLAEKFVTYYWRQTAPYPAGTDSAVLLQNTDKQAAIINLVNEARRRFGDSLPRAKADRSAWKALCQDVARVIRVMPLWKLQTLAGKRLSLLYENVGSGGRIELLPGIAAGFRKFYPLIRSVVQGHWMRQVETIKANHAIVGHRVELSEFLFGSERAMLAAVRPVLFEVQNGTCLYCTKAVTDGLEVDHFIPWSRYPVDLGHNFVLAHARCNAKKKDHLAAVQHYHAWFARNRDHDQALRERFQQTALPHDLQTSLGIAEWAYDQARTMGADTWIEGSTFEKVPAEFRVYRGWKG